MFFKRLIFGFSMWLLWNGSSLKYSTTSGWDLTFFKAVIIKHSKILNLYHIRNKNNKKRNEKWPFIRDHSYRILIIGGSGLGKTNALLNLINEQDDIDKIYLHAKDLSEPKYEFLMKKREDVGIVHLNDRNAFIE